MASRKNSTMTVTEVRLKVPGDLKKEIRDFRAKRTLSDQPITSDEKAILHLAKRGLEAERV